MDELLTQLSNEIEKGATIQLLFGNNTHKAFQENLENVNLRSR
jgi:hypothetical protein